MIHQVKYIIHPSTRPIKSIDDVFGITEDGQLIQLCMFDHIALKIIQGDTTWFNITLPSIEGSWYKIPWSFKTITDMNDPILLSALIIYKLERI